MFPNEIRIIYEINLLMHKFSTGVAGDAESDDDKKPVAEEEKDPEEEFNMIDGQPDKFGAKMAAFHTDAEKCVAEIDEMLKMALGSSKKLAYAFVGELV